MFFPSSYGELLHLHGLSHENGYLVTCEYSVDYKKYDLIYLDNKCVIHKYKGENIYGIQFTHRIYTFYHESISRKQLKKLLTTESETKKYYIKYNIKGDPYTAKKVNTCVNITPERELMVTNIKNKIKKIPELTINILLHGEPGTGKSSFVDKFATIIERDVHILPLSRPNILKDVVDSISCEKDLLILIPEIDKMLNEKGEPIHSENELYEFLDGCNRPPGSIILITCNDVKRFKSNKILSRPGRIHFELYFQNVTMDDVKYMVNRYYPEITDYSSFEKYVGTVSHAEFNAALCQYFIMDKDINKFKITMKTIKPESSRLYY